jgi:hypothetical protein
MALGHCLENTDLLEIYFDRGSSLQKITGGSQIGEQL